MVFFANLAPLGRFCVPFWGQLGAKGLSKSIILASSRTKISRNDIQNEASEKASAFYSKMFGRSEFLKGLNPPKCFV